MSKRIKAGVATRATMHAPWRIEFIKGPKDQGCFMCEAAALPKSAVARWKELLLLHKDKHALIIMNKYPYTGGHLLVAPLRHTAHLGGLSNEEARSMWNFTRLATDVLKAVMEPQGFNVGMNLGRAAGAGIEDHLHMHVIPRWVGDTNYWPVIGGTHTIPVALAALWDELYPAFKNKR